MPGTAAEDLSGVWDGQYNYPAAKAPTPFQASLLDQAGTLSGSITEKSTLRPRAGEPLYAVVRGVREGGAVRFTKRYESDDPRYQVVAYEGRVSGDGNEIEGTWRTGGWTGRFLMIRAARLGAVVGKVVEEVG